MMDDHTLRHGWSIQRIVGGILLSALSLLATHTAWHDILTIAMHDEEYSHIFLVPFVAAWLVWVRRRRWRQCRPQGTWIGPLIIAAGWAFFSLGDLYLIQAFWHGGAVIVFVGCLLSVLGKDVLVRFLPAFIVLGFLIPVPGLLRQQIALPLQALTALATHTILETLGVDIGLAGNVLTINGTEVAVAEACNGLRMVFALTLVCYAFAFGTPLRLYARLIVLAASPISAILCNVIRLLPTVWLYGYHPGTVADLFHNISGWVMLPIAFFCLMAILYLLRWSLIPVTRYTLAYD